MDESSINSCNEIRETTEIQVGLSSSSLPDCFGPSRISIGRMEGGSLATSVMESIEKSKSHWSKVGNVDCSEEVTEVSNVQLFKTLQRHPRWGTFFMSFGEGKGSYGELVMGWKFAEGGQAELYEVHIQWSNEKMRADDLKYMGKWVLKVFKKGTFLRHLQTQWPQGMLKFEADRVKRTKLGLPSHVRLHSDVFGSTLLEDGRFAFLMVKEKEDPQSLIDHQEIGPNMGPLSMKETMEAMYEVAYGMKQLHDRGIVHQDLKASNVLLSKNGGRPEVPQYVDGWICQLLNRCWQSNPTWRLSFMEILATLVANSGICRDCNLERLRNKQRHGIQENSKGLWMIVEKFRSLRLKL